SMRECPPRSRAFGPAPAAWRLYDMCNEREGTAKRPAPQRIRRSGGNPTKSAQAPYYGVRVSNRTVATGARRSAIMVRSALRRASADVRVLPDFVIIGAQKAGTTSL